MEKGKQKITTKTEFNFSLVSSTVSDEVAHQKGEIRSSKHEEGREKKETESSSSPSSITVSPHRTLYVGDVSLWTLHLRVTRQPSNTSITSRNPDGDDSINADIHNQTDEKEERGEIDHNPSKKKQSSSHPQQRQNHDNDQGRLLSVTFYSEENMQSSAFPSAAKGKTEARGSRSSSVLGQASLSWNTVELQLPSMMKIISAKEEKETEGKINNIPCSIKASSAATSSLESIEISQRKDVLIWSVPLSILRFCRQEGGSSHEHGTHKIGDEQQTSVSYRLLISVKCIAQGVQSLKMLIKQSLFRGGGNTADTASSHKRDTVLKSASHPVQVRGLEDTLVSELNTVCELTMKHLGRPPAQQLLFQLLSHPNVTPSLVRLVISQMFLSPTLTELAVSLLGSAPADVVTAFSSSAICGCIPLVHYAVLHEDFELFDVIFQSKAVKEKEKHSALLVAMRLGHKQFVHTIISGGYCHGVFAGEYSLHCAVRQQIAIAVRELLEAHTNPNVLDVDGISPLFLCCQIAKEQELMFAGQKHNNTKPLKIMDEKKGKESGCDIGGASSSSRPWHPDQIQKARVTRFTILALLLSSKTLLFDPSLACHKKEGEAIRSNNEAIRFCVDAGLVAETLLFLQAGGPSHLLLSAPSREDEDEECPIVLRILTSTHFSPQDKVQAVRLIAGKFGVDPHLCITHSHSSIPWQRTATHIAATATMSETKMLSMFIELQPLAILNTLDAQQSTPLLILCQQYHHPTFIFRCIEQLLSYIYVRPGTSTTKKYTQELIFAFSQMKNGDGKTALHLLSEAPNLLEHKNTFAAVLKVIPVSQAFPFDQNNATPLWNVLYYSALKEDDLKIFCSYFLHLQLESSGNKVPVSDSSHHPKKESSKAPHPAVPLSAIRQAERSTQVSLLEIVAQKGYAGIMAMIVPHIPKDWMTSNYNASQVGSPTTSPQHHEDTVNSNNTMLFRMNRCLCFAMQYERFDHPFTVKEKLGEGELPSGDTDKKSNAPAAATTHYEMDKLEISLREKSVRLCKTLLTHLQPRIEVFPLLQLLDEDQNQQEGKKNLQSDVVGEETKNQHENQFFKTSVFHLAALRCFPEILHLIVDAKLCALHTCFDDDKMSPLDVLLAQPPLYQRFLPFHNQLRYFPDIMTYLNGLDAKHHHEQQAFNKPQVDAIISTCEVLIQDIKIQWERYVPLRRLKVEVEESSSTAVDDEEQVEGNTEEAIFQSEGEKDEEGGKETVESHHPKKKGRKEGNESEEKQEEEGCPDDQNPIVEKADEEIDKQKVEKENEVEEGGDEERISSAEQKASEEVSAANESPSEIEEDGNELEEKTTIPENEEKNKKIQKEQKTTKRKKPQRKHHRQRAYTFIPNVVFNILQFTCCSANIHLVDHILKHLEKMNLETYFSRTYRFVEEIPAVIFLDAMMRELEREDEQQGEEKKVASSGRMTHFFAVNRRLVEELLVKLFRPLQANHVSPEIAFSVSRRLIQFGNISPLRFWVKTRVGSQSLSYKSGKYGSIAIFAAVFYGEQFDQCIASAAAAGGGEKTIKNEGLTGNTIAVNPQSDISANILKKLEAILLVLLDCDELKVDAVHPETGLTLLHLVIGYGMAEAVRNLVARNCDVNICNVQQGIMPAIVYLFDTIDELYRTRTLMMMTTSSSTSQTTPSGETLFSLSSISKNIVEMFNALSLSGRVDISLAVNLRGNFFMKALQCYGCDNSLIKRVVDLGYAVRAMDADSTFVQEVIRAAILNQRKEMGDDEAEDEEEEEGLFGKGPCEDDSGEVESRSSDLVKEKNSDEGDGTTTTPMKHESKTPTKSFTTFLSSTASKKSRKREKRKVK